MKNGIPQILLIPAVITGGKVDILDRQGKPLRLGIPLDLVSGSISKNVFDLYLWSKTSQRMLWKILRRRGVAKKSSWQKKAESLEHSIHYRMLQRSPIRGRCRFENYSTSTWEQAAKRLWKQADHRKRRHSESGWPRWAHTAANNHNKRKGGCYAES